MMVAASSLAVCSCNEEPAEKPIPASSYARAEEPRVYARPQGDATRPVQFTDITTPAGIEFTHVNGATGKKWMPETVGAGGAFFDYDGDDWPDIILVNGSNWPGEGSPDAKPTGKVYRNLGTQPPAFEDVTERSGLSKLTCYGMGPVIADYDGDGDEDVYITAVGKNHLLRNDGGRFVDVTDQAGVGFSSCCGVPSDWEWSIGATWLDYDRDGDLDLFVANYVQWTPETDVWTTLDGEIKSYSLPQVYDGATCVLFRNEGGGAFTDVTREAGVFNPRGKSMGVVADDFNDDGWPDVVVTNDTQPNFLYVNNQDGTFTDDALFAGMAYDENGLARAGMGVSVADVENNGLRSIAIGNFSGEPVSLYTQVAQGTFIDRAGATRLSKPTNTTLTFGVQFADFDLDGYDDLILANGHIEPEIARVRDAWTFEQTPQLFKNNGKGRFVEITEEAGAPFRVEAVWRCIAVADIDRDGDLDALLTTNGGPAYLLRNDQTTEHGVVRVSLVADRTNPRGIGSRLKATIGDMIVSRYVTTGGSFVSQSELAATFGLGAHDAVDKLEIRWPNGTVEAFTDLPANTRCTIEYGRGVVSTEDFRDR
jgi:hypothetical protein